jgi:hypothetical protein
VQYGASVDDDGNAATSPYNTFYVSASGNTYISGDLTVGKTITSTNTKASGSFSGSYFGNVTSKNTKATGSFSGNITSTNTKASGSFSGSYRGSIISKNTKASGSFSGSHYGSLVSKNTKASGSFSGSFYGSVLSKNTKASGSFSGSHYGSLVSKNTKASGSFSGSFYGSLLSKNTKASGSFSGSHYGSLVSKNTKASGSFSGSFYGSVLSKNTKASGSFSGSHYGKLIGSKGSLITGSFRGIDNITNFKGTGKKVSFNGTASYSVSSSFATTASFTIGGISSGFDKLGSSLYKDKTSETPLINHKNGHFTMDHSFGTVPSLIRATLVCINGDQGYSINDEISVEQLYDDTGDADDERPITSVWASDTQAGVAFANWEFGVFGTKKYGGRSFPTSFNQTSWKVKIRIWK